MMSTEGLPVEVVRFLQERIDSVPHLEALLIIWGGGTTWDAPRIAARIYIEEPAAQAVLQDLQRGGLAISEDRISFGFNADSESTRALVSQVAESYKRNVTRVATLIHNKASSSVREFARAFDLKKER
jgi:hypothetical protein